LLSLRAHSAALIEAVLRYYFKHADLVIEQCIERRVDILDEQRNRLGRANSLLGEDLVLGERVRDRSGKFRIHIANWTGSAFTNSCRSVSATSRCARWCDSPCVTRSITTFAWCCARKKSANCALASKNACRLGWTSWLGCESADGVVTLGSKIH
jgi:type VI secretion system protein ImpH